MIYDLITNPQTARLKAKEEKVSPTEKNLVKSCAMLENAAR